MPDGRTDGWPGAAVIIVMQYPQWAGHCGRLIEMRVTLFAVADDL